MIESLLDTKHFSGVWRDDPRVAPPAAARR
jgi:hypothetical protein